MAPDFSLKSLVGRKEDHLTAMFALALELDEQFRDAAAVLLLGNLPTLGGTRNRVSRIDVQRSFETGDCPDMALTLDDGRLVLIENKLEAPETIKALTDPGGDPNVPDSAPGQIKTAQLERYLALPGIAGLAFIRSTYKTLPQAVSDHKLYLRPASGAAHFLWRDFYPSLVLSTHPMTAWLREAFDANDFVPPTPEIGDLSDASRRRNMQKLLEPTAALAREMGWSVGRGSVCELWMSRDDGGFVDSVWVNPMTERLLVRLRPRAETLIAHVVEAADRAVSELSEGLMVTVGISGVAQKSGVREVVDISAPMRSVVGSASDTQALETRFVRFVEPVLRSLAC